MKFIYKPENPADGDPREWDINLDRMRQSEAEAIEREFGGTKDEFDQGVMTGNSRARKVLFLHLLRKEHPRAQMRDVPDFYTGEIDVELDGPELRKVRDKITKNAGLSDFERTDILTRIDAEIAEKEVDGEVIAGVVVATGKALSKKSEAATG
jgi:hypothetical protein